uniref:Uncharacterized protein n=1 Tax=Arundo donax TaxID=35708 RepID=A0A0A9F8V9_ARUDO
MGRFLLCY